MDGGASGTGSVHTCLMARVAPRDVQAVADLADLDGPVFGCTA